MFQAIKEYYELGLYTEQDLNLFVEVGWITAKQKEEIEHSTDTSTNNQIV